MRTEHSFNKHLLILVLWSSAQHQCMQVNLAPMLTREQILARDSERTRHTWQIQYLAHGSYPVNACCWKEGRREGWKGGAKKGAMEGRKEKRKEEGKKGREEGGREGRKGGRKKVRKEGREGGRKVLTNQGPTFQTTQALSQARRGVGCSHPS